LACASPDWCCAARTRSAKSRWTNPDLIAGWWAVERDGQVLSRWTDGEALLPLPEMKGDAMLEVHLAGTMTYVVQEATEPRAA
jgi:hypothetical protein